MKIRHVVEIGIFIFLLSFPFLFSKQDANMDDLIKTIEPYVNTDIMQQQDDSMIYRNFHLGHDLYVSYISYGPISFMDVDEITIFKVKPDTANQVLDAVLSHIENQKQSFKGYGVEQTKLLEDSYVELKGSYVICVIKQDSKQIEQAIDECY